MSDFDIDRSSKSIANEKLKLTQDYSNDLGSIIEKDIERTMLFFYIIFSLCIILFIWLIIVKIKYDKDMQELNDSVENKFKEILPKNREMQAFDVLQDALKELDQLNNEIQNVARHHQARYGIQRKDY